MARSSQASRCFKAMPPWLVAGTVALTCWQSSAASMGRIVSWGGGQALPANAPSNIVAVSTAMDHSLALKADGTVFAWGNNMNGQSTVPAGLANVLRIAAGEFFSVALKSDSSIVTWGANDYFQREVPSGLSGVREISAGHAHCLALKIDGTVVGWGCDVFGQATIPANLIGVKSILAAWNYSVAVRSNGTVVAWGVNDTGQTNVPAGLANVNSVAGNNYYCLALRNDGTVTAWGQVPPLPSGLTSIVAIAAGETHALALNSSGTIIAWGANQSGATTVPTTLRNPLGLAASWHYSAALEGSGVSPFVLSNPRWHNNRFTVSVPSQSGMTYALEYKSAVTDANWTSLPTVAGNGSVITLTNDSAAQSRRLYRVRGQ